MATLRPVYLATEIAQRSDSDSSSGHSMVNRGFRGLPATGDSHENRESNRRLALLQNDTRTSVLQREVLWDDFDPEYAMRTSRTRTIRKRASRTGETLEAGWESKGTSKLLGGAKQAIRSGG